MPGLERAARFAACLAGSLERLDRRVWCRVVERAQDTIELAGFGGSLRLAGHSLVLTWAERDMIFRIGPALSQGGALYTRTDAACSA